MRKLNKELLIATVKKLCEGGYKNEEVLNQDIDFVLESVNDPDVINYIFSLKYKLTPEEIVEKALSYKPLITPPPKRDE